MRDRAGALVLAALAPAAMLALDPGGLYPFGPAKWLAVSVLVPAGAALTSTRGPVPAGARRATLALAALVAAMALAAAVGEDGLYAWVGTPERHLGVLAWVLVALAFVAGQRVGADRGTRDLVARGMVVAGVGVGLAAATEALGAGPDVLDAGSRLGATFGSPAYLGAACCLLLPANLAVALDRAAPRAWRSAAAIGSATTTLAVLGSGARAAWVGLAAALVVTGVARRVRRRSAVAGAAGVAVVLAVLALLTPVGGRIGQAFDPDAPGGRGRLDEWRVAAAVLAGHPLTGVGPEGYRIAFAEGVDRAYERAHGRDPLPDRAHSGPLDLALAGGPLGLLAWSAAVAATAPSVRRALRAADATTAGLAAAVVAYVAGQVLLFPLAELEPVAALLAGLLTTAGAGGVPAAARARPDRSGATAARAALGMLAALALVAGGLDVAADRRARQAVDALARDDTVRAVEHARAATGLRPDVLRNHLLLAITLEADDQGALAAIGAVDDALDLSPGDPVARRRRAALLVRRAGATLVPTHVAAARTYLEELLAGDPLDAGLHRLAAAAAALGGDAAGAAAHRATAEDLDPGGDGTG